MALSPVIIPTVADGFAIRQMGLGTDSYDLTEPYPPDTGIWRSKVLDLGSPKFQPNSTYAFDRSRYNNHGTITGATWVGLPSGLRVLSFNGTSDKVTVTATALFDVGATTNFTVIAWAKGLTGNDVSAELIQRKDANYWQIRGAAGKFRFLVYGAGGGTESTSTVPTDDNLWHFVAGVHNVDVTNFLQVDAAVTDTDTDIVGALTLTDDVKIGGGETAFWKGDIALVRYLQRGLTATELTSIFNREKHLFRR